MPAESIETQSLKVWDRSMLDDVLEVAVRELVASTGTQSKHVAITRTGPDIYTVTLNRDDALTHPPQEVPC